MRGTLLVIRSTGQRVRTPLTAPPTKPQIDAAVGGPSQLVQMFEWIEEDGVEGQRCKAWMLRDTGEMPQNPQATVMWTKAQAHSLRHQSQGHGDVLLGDVAVVYGDEDLMRFA